MKKQARLLMFANEKRSSLLRKSKKKSFVKFGSSCQLILHQKDI
jgi:hypothetical protein